MKDNLKHIRHVVTTVGIVVGLALLPASSVSADDDEQAGIYSPEENVFGMSYGDWSAAWWQYVLSIETGANPVFDTTGINCDIAQSSAPVFFLAGAGAEPVTRTCTVPAEKALFIPIINVECSTVEPAPFFGSTAQELRTCVARSINGVDEDTLKATIDGKSVQNLTDFRAQSPLFDFTLPAANNFFGLAGVTSGSSMSDGYWLMLKPLSPGNHVIHFEGAYVSGPAAGFSQNVTYNLIVKG